MKRKLTAMAVLLFVAFAAIVPSAHADTSLSSSSSVTAGQENWERDVLEQARKAPIYPDKGAVTAFSASSLPSRKGVILITPDKWKGSVPYIGHAAIVYSSSKVVESNPGSGVAFGNNDWDKSKKEVYGRTVLGTSIEQDEAAAEWTKKQIGKGYSIDFFNKNRRDIFYCSHLVWAAYKDTLGIDIDLDESLYGSAVAPYELIHNEKNMYTIFHQVK